MSKRDSTPSSGRVSVDSLDSFDASSQITAAADADSHIDTLGPGPDDELPPPAYGAHYGTIEDVHEKSGTAATLTDDGRINVRIRQPTRGLSSLLVPGLRSQLDLLHAQGPAPPPYVPPQFTERPDGKPPPRLNVVIHVVGSRGDVQPFVALGKVLKEVHKHRVRLATHPVFKNFVEENGLEFFNIGGDPAELMAFMVKNPGLMPGFDTLRSGDVGKRRREIASMVKCCWRSCIETGDGSGLEASDKNIEAWDSATDDAALKPFIAEAIIANPPSFAHLHCAEKLGIPLHLMFTMPWSPTQAFPHPLANIQSTNTDANMTNFITYALVEMMTWQGLGDVINRFRQRSLGLSPISSTWAPGMLSRMKIPWTYCWSPALIPKPGDWGPHIEISGFYFLNLAADYTPNQDLQDFLNAGPTPIYIGFGSIVVDDPNAMTKMIFEAVEKTGQRALVSKGWGGFGADEIGIPEGVFMLGNVPHDWLFKHVSAVVHHGGAGTTAAGIAAGKPTVIVPFFGDQPFWGAMVAKAGAGPKPVPYKALTADILAESIQTALLPATIEKAAELSQRISTEKGTEDGANSFHQFLEVDRLRCTLCPDRAAVWRLRRTQVRLSAFAATALGYAKLIQFSDLKLYRPQEHHTEDEPFDPVTGATSALLGTLGSMAMGVFDMPVSALKVMNIHPDSQSKSQVNLKATAHSTSGQRTPASELDLEARTPSLSTVNSRSTDTSSIPGMSRPTVAHAIANNMEQSAAAAQQACPDATPEIKIDPPETKQGVKWKATFSAEDAMATGEGFYKIAAAGLKSPVDFTMGIARGFHNAPKLYGDDTVRPSERITGIPSGLKAAGKGFGLGFYDGVTGLVTQPIDGAKKEGVAGLLKGIGKGVGGVILKPGAAIWGVPGYTSQGIYKELKKLFGPSMDNYIIASRTAQGYDEVRNSTEDERAAVISRWKEIKPHIRKKKTIAEGSKETMSRVRSRNWSRTKLAKSKSEAATEDVPEPDLIPGQMDRVQSFATDTTGIVSPSDSVSRAPTLPTGKPLEEKSSLERAENADFEEAVRRSVAETSKGNPEEDEMIERAVRASVAELEARPAQQVEAARRLQQATKDAPRGREVDIDSGFGSGIPSEVDDEETWDEQQMRQALEESHTTYAEAEEKARRDEENTIREIIEKSLAEEEQRKSSTAT